MAARGPTFLKTIDNIQDESFIRFTVLFHGHCVQIPKDHWLMVLFSKIIQHQATFFYSWHLWQSTLYRSVFLFLFSDTFSGFNREPQRWSLLSVTQPNILAANGRRFFLALHHTALIEFEPICLKLCMWKRFVNIFESRLESFQRLIWLKYIIQNGCIHSTSL